jgi:hypothetical protein
MHLSFRHRPGGEPNPRLLLPLPYRSLRPLSDRIADDDQSALDTMLLQTASLLLGGAAHASCRRAFQPRSMIVDPPFLVTIRDRVSNALIFFGRIADPAAAAPRADR